VESSKLIVWLSRGKEQRRLSRVDIGIGARGERDFPSKKGHSPCDILSY
jgi:hypothetical protein